MPPKKIPSDGAVVFNIGPVATNANQNIIWQGIVGSEDRAAETWANSYQRFVKDRPASQMPPAPTTYPVKKLGSTGVLQTDQVQLPPMPVNRCRDSSEFKQRPRGVPYMLPPRKFVKQWNHATGPYKQYENIPYKELPEKHIMHEVTKGIYHTQGTKPLAPTRYIRGAGVKDWTSYLSASGKNNRFHGETTHTDMCGPRTVKPQVDPMRDPCEEYSLAVNGPDGVSVNEKAVLPVCLGKQGTLNDLRNTADGTLKLDRLQQLHDIAPQKVAQTRRARKGDRGPGVLPGAHQQWPGVQPQSRDFSAKYACVTPTPNETIRANMIEQHRKETEHRRAAMLPSRVGTGRSMAESVASHGSMRDEVEALKQQVAQLQAQVARQDNNSTAGSRRSTAQPRSKSSMWPMPTVATGPMHTPMPMPTHPSTAIMGGNAGSVPSTALCSRGNVEYYNVQTTPPTAHC